MFCTIEDAWGSALQSNNISSSSGLGPNINDNKRFADKDIFQQSDKPESFKTIEYFGMTNPDDEQSNTKTIYNNEQVFNKKSNESIKEDMYNKYIQLKEMFGNEEEEKKESEVCIALDNHLQKCSRCRSKYLKYKYYNDNNNYNNGFDLSKIMTNIRLNKDMITIFLFGLLIILLLQLFSSK